MIFSRSFVLALFSAPFAVLAQNPNAPKVPESGLQVTAGEPFTLEWNPTTEGTVTLILRSGASSDLNEGEIIASSIDNSGSYTWNVPSSAVRGSDYTIEIVDDSDPTQTNYTPYFVLESTNTVATPLSTISLGAPSTSLSLSTASPTASPSAFPLQSGITLDTSAHHSTTTPHRATTDSSASSSAAASSSSASDASTTGSSASTGSQSSSASGSRTTSAGTASTSSQAGLVATQTTNGGARATAMVGMLGAVALGALAL